MAQINEIFTTLRGEIVPPVVEDGMEILPANTFQARAYANGEDIHEGVLATPFDQTTFTPPHPLRNCMRFQWMYDNISGEQPVEIPGETDDHYTIDTSAVANSGNYWCRITIGSIEADTAQRCIVVDCPITRVVIVDCDYTNQNSGQIPTIPYEGGVATAHIIHPGFYVPHFEPNPTADWITSPSFLGTTVDGSNATQTCDVTTSTFDLTIAPGENNQARQAYANINLREFNCKFAVTQDYPLEGEAVEVPMETITRLRRELGPGSLNIAERFVNHEVEPGDTITTNARFTIQRQTGQTFTDVYGPTGIDDGTGNFNYRIRWSTDQGTVGDTSNSRAAEQIIDIFGTDVVIPEEEAITGFVTIAPPSDDFVGTGTLTAEAVRVSDNVVVATDSTTIEWTGLPQTPTVISYTSGPTFAINAQNGRAPFTGEALDNVVTGTFTISGSNAIANMSILRTSYLGVFGTIANPSTPTTGNINIVGPTMVNQALSVSGTDPLATMETSIQLTPGNYSYTVRVDEGVRLEGSSASTGLVSLNLSPTILPNFMF